MTLILSDNIIWHAYRHQIFRLVISLICTFCIEDEEWIGEKLHYRKINTLLDIARLLRYIYLQ